MLQKSPERCSLVKLVMLNVYQKNSLAFCRGNQGDANFGGNLVPFPNASRQDSNLIHVSNARFLIMLAVNQTSSAPSKGPIQGLNHT